MTESCFHCFYCHTTSTPAKTVNYTHPCLHADQAVVPLPYAQHVGRSSSRLDIHHDPGSTAKKDTHNMMRDNFTIAAREGRAGQPSCTPLETQEFYYRVPRYQFPLKSEFSEVRSV